MGSILQLLVGKSSSTILASKGVSRDALGTATRGMTTPSEFYTRHSASATRVELWYPTMFVKFFVKGQDKSAVSVEASRVLGLGVQLKGTAKGFEPKIHGLLLEFSKLTILCVLLTI